MSTYAIDQMVKAEILGTLHDAEIVEIVAPRQRPTVIVRNAEGMIFPCKSFVIKILNGKSGRPRHHWVGASQVKPMKEEA